MGIGAGLIGGAMQGGGAAALQLTNKAADYVEKSTLQDEAAQIQALRDKRLEEFASAREQRGYSHAETMQGQGFAHAENLAEARQAFDAEQHELTRGVTREQIASHEKVAAANNATALQIANIGGTVQPDKDGNILWIGKDGKAKPIMDPNNPGEALKSYKDLTPAAKAYSDVLKAQLVDLDKAEQSPMVDDAQRATIKRQRAEYTGQLLNVLTGGIGAVKIAAPEMPPAPPQAIAALKKDPALAAQFDAKYGQGASQRALQAGATAPAAAAAPGGSELVSEPPGTPPGPGQGLIARARAAAQERADAEEARRAALKEKGEGYGIGY